MDRRTTDGQDYCFPVSPSFNNNYNNDCYASKRTALEHRIASMWFYNVIILCWRNEFIFVNCCLFVFHLLRTLPPSHQLGFEHVLSSTILTVENHWAWSIYKLSLTCRKSQVSMHCKLFCGKSQVLYVISDGDTFVWSSHAGNAAPVLLLEFSFLVVVAFSAALDAREPRETPL